MDPIRHPSSFTNHSHSPATPTTSRRTSGQDSIFSTPQRPLYASPEDFRTDRVKSSNAGAQSDSRNGAIIRRPPMSYSQTDALPTPQELLMQVGRLDQDIKHKQEAIKDLELKLEVERHQKQDFQQQVWELQSQAKRLESDTRTLSAQQASSAATIRDLEKKLDRANQTIRVQSAQILNPRDGRKYNAQPRHYELQPRAIASGHEDVAYPPQHSFEMVPYKGGRPHRATQTSAYHNQPLQQQHGSFTMRRGPSQKSNPFEDEDREPRTHPGPSTQHPAVRYTSHSLTNSDPETGYGALVPPNFHDFAQVRPNLMSMLNVLFNSTEKWAVDFASATSSNADLNLTYQEHMQISQITNPDLLNDLLAAPQTRHATVTKLILSNVVNFAFWPLLVRNFKPTFDERLLEQKDKVYTGVPNQIRRESMVATSAIIEEMIQDPEWEEFIGKRTTDKTRQLWQMVKPFLDQGKPPPEAWQGLYRIWEDAVKIGLIMLRNVAMYSVDFPPVGPNSPFNPANMVSRDPEFNQDPRSLAKMDLKVRLSISPVVNETDFSIGSNMLPRSLAFAKVLLMR